MILDASIIAKWFLDELIDSVIVGISISALIAALNEEG